MRCNIFKPLSNDTGEFLMFSQYVDDLTREDAAKATYRVVPSKFAVLDLNLKDFLEYINGHGTAGDKTGDNIQILNRDISQYFQSYYENMVCTVKDSLGVDEEGEMYWDKDSEEDGFASQMLWKFLQTVGLITKSTPTGVDFETFPELKFVGDVNIHSDRVADGMHYNDIYCYISPSDNEYYYQISEIEGFPYDGGNDSRKKIFDLESTDFICGWTQASYPPNNGGIDPAPRSDGGNYNMSGGYRAIFEEPVCRHSTEEKNIQYMFNCIIVFYDIYNDLDDENGPTILHKNRPLGIYFTGPAVSETNLEDIHMVASDGSQILRNQVSKYISHDDIFGQGTGWSVRLMTRVVPTPNSTSYAFFVDQGDDYGTVAAAMGQIANAIADIRTDMKLQAQNYQLMKDHLAMFKNYRTNIPYVRDVQGTKYWFVNGRNTEQPVYEPLIETI